MYVCVCVCVCPPFQFSNQLTIFIKLGMNDMSLKETETTHFLICFRISNKNMAGPFNISCHKEHMFAVSKQKIPPKQKLNRLQLCVHS
jgi:hypothetical protein